MSRWGPPVEDQPRLAGNRLEGFSVDPATGRWERKPDADRQDPGERRTVTGVRPYVQDMRNLLMLCPVSDKFARPFLLSLLYVLKRAIQFVYHLEEQEIEAELIGQGDHLRLLYWEAAEGGTGVWHRLAGEQGAVAEIAAQARRRGLLSLSAGQRQPERAPAPGSYSAPDILGRGGGLKPDACGHPGKTRDPLQAATCLDRFHLEQDFLHFLHAKGLRLPDEAQNRPVSDLYVQPDFYCRHTRNRSCRAPVSS